MEQCRRRDPDNVTLSILSSIVIVEALFPGLADRPWLSQKWFVGFTLWLGAICAWLFFTYGFVVFHGKGFDHPPITYGIAPLLFALFLVLGLHRYHPKATASEVSVRPAPGLWTLRLLAFAAASVVLIMTGIVLVNLFALGVLIWLAHRMARWEAAKATSIARANERLSPIASHGGAKKGTHA
jgi:hypothetical protein